MGLENKEVIYTQDTAIFEIDGEQWVTNLYLSKVTGKRPVDITRSVKSIWKKLSQEEQGCFRDARYKDPQNRSHPLTLLNTRGCSMLMQTYASPYREQVQGILKDMGMSFDMIPANVPIFEKGIRCVIKDEVPYATSFLIEEITGKEHFNILRDIREGLDTLKNSGEFEDSCTLIKVEECAYISDAGKLEPMYILSEDSFSVILGGYDILHRARIQVELRRYRDGQIPKSEAPKLPLNYIDALKALVCSEEEKEKERLRADAEAERADLAEKTKAQISTKAQATALANSGAKSKVIKKLEGVIEVKDAVIKEKDLEVEILKACTGHSSKFITLHFLKKKYRDRDFSHHALIKYCNDTNMEILKLPPNPEYFGKQSSHNTRLVNSYPIEAVSAVYGIDFSKRSGEFKFDEKPKIVALPNKSPKISLDDLVFDNSY